jgi:hypothetical protein
MSAVAVGIGVVVVLVVLAVVIYLQKAPKLKGKRVNGAWESYIHLEMVDGYRQTIYAPIYVGWDGTIYQNGEVYARIAGDRVVSIGDTAPVYTVNGRRMLATFFSGTVNSSAVVLTSSSLTDVGIEGITFRWERTR